MLNKRSAIDQTVKYLSLMTVDLSVDAIFLNHITLTFFCLWETVGSIAGTNLNNTQC